MIGRETEMGLLRAASRSVSSSGLAVLVEGAPGLGKTTLLKSVGEDLEREGFRVLACSGDAGQVTEGYGALRELLDPVLDLASSLPSRQRTALLTAFGMSDAQRPERLLTHIAVLGLLEEAAAGQRVVVIVDDAHWVDRSTLDALLFVCRRLTRSPLLMVFSVRQEEEVAETLRAAPVETIVLGPMGRDEARAVVEDAQPDLPAEAVRAVLRASDGNPQALTEFAAIRGEGHGSGLSDDSALPVSERLTEAFLAGAESLPDGGRALLLLLAVGGEVPVQDLLASGSHLGATSKDLTAVEASGLATVTGASLRFRHPLVGTAVLGGASPADRREAHGALAVTAHDAERAAWHRAEAALDRNEDVASQLERAALSANQRGARSEAVLWLRRAAALSVDARAEVRRLAVAAEIAREAGLVHDCEALLDQAMPLAEDPDVVALLAAAELLFTLTTGRPGASIGEKLRTADLLAGPDPQAHVLERSAILLGVCARWHLQDGGPVPDRRLKDAVDNLPQPGNNWIQLLAAGYLDPVAAAPTLAGVLPGLVEAASDELLPGNVGAAGDPRWLFSVGLVAQLQQDLGTALAAWEAALRSSRLLSSGVDEAVTLSGRALCQLTRGRLASSLSDAEQALRLSYELGLPFLTGMSAGIAAVARAQRGENDEAAEAVQTALRATAVAPSALVSALTSWANGQIALNDGHVEDAWDHLREVAGHPPTSGWAIADQAEAAVRAGRPEELTDELARVSRIADQLPGSHWIALVARARALLDDADADEQFRRALEATTSEASPLELAKHHLAYGSWLRREHSIDAARSHLQSALDLLTPLGARPLVDRALTELARTGESVDSPAAASRRGPSQRLTPQEWRIAQSASTGLTDVEIADQMFLSPRTVATHLDNAFRKLGIDHRAQLSEVLLDL